MLIEQFEYMAEMANRLSRESLPHLKKSFKEDTNQMAKNKKYALIQQIKSFLELYQTYSIQEYDYWTHKNQQTFALFVEKFEKEAQSLEVRSSQLILDVNGIEEFKSGKHYLNSMIQTLIIDNQPKPKKKDSDRGDQLRSQASLHKMKTQNSMKKIEPLNNLQQ